MPPDPYRGKSLGDFESMIIYSHYMYEDLLKELLMLTLEQTCFIANVTANIANVISV